MADSLLPAWAAAARWGGVLAEVAACEAWVEGGVRWNRCAVPRAEDTASQSPEEEKATPWITAGVTPRDSLQGADTSSGEGMMTHTANHAAGERCSAGAGKAGFAKP